MECRRLPLAVILVSLTSILYAALPNARTTAPAPGVATSPTGASPSEQPPAEPEPEVRAAPRPPWADLTVEDPPADPSTLAKAGAAIYTQHCVTCHGPEGKGNGPAAALLDPQPRNFTRGLFKFKTSVPEEMPFDDDLYRTITHGIPAGGMPSYKDLTPFERWALVAHVKSLSKWILDDGRVLEHFKRSPSETRLKLPAPPEAAKADLAKGKHLYQSKIGCVACHGPEGRGDGPAAATLVDVFDRPIRVPDIERGEVTFKAGSRPQDIYRVLVSGMAGTPMPSFASVLNEEDRWDLAHYIASLYKPIPPGEKIFLTAGCTSCHTVGKGKIIGPDLAGIAQRRSADWLRRWLADPPGMIATDPDARKLFEEHLVPMPSPGLTKGDIEHLIDFLKTLPPAAPAGQKTSR